MKNDLRVTLTRRMLREALLRLLPQKPLSRITVSELCREAGVNRVTFYNHFETPTAILRDLAWEYAERLRDIYEDSRRQQLSEEAALEACLSYLFARKSEIRGNPAANLLTVSKKSDWAFIIQKFSKSSYLLSHQKPPF